MSRTLSCMLSLICLVSSPGTSQKRTPPGIRDVQQYETNHPLEPPLVIKPRLDLDEMQRQAQQLASLAQSVPADVDKVAAGVLPKDTINKLRQIEKLSKGLRSKLAK
jgi:hypothetical protein